MYSYDGLNKILKEKNMKKSELSAKLGISSRTISKIAKGEKLADHDPQKGSRRIKHGGGKKHFVPAIYHIDQRHVLYNTPVAGSENGKAVYKEGQNKQISILDFLGCKKDNCHSDDRCLNKPGSRERAFKQQ